MLLFMFYVFCPSPKVQSSSGGFGHKSGHVCFLSDYDVGMVMWNLWHFVNFEKKMVKKDEFNLGHGKGGLGQHLALPLHLLHKHHLPQGLLLERQLYHHLLHHQLQDDEQGHWLLDPKRTNRVSTSDLTKTMTTKNTCFCNWCNCWLAVFIACWNCKMFSLASSLSPIFH